jgi:hypothetical protein
MSPPPAAAVPYRNERRVSQRRAVPSFDMPLSLPFGIFMIGPELRRHDDAWTHACMKIR